MTKPIICEACGKPLDQHVITLEGGVAHAAHVGPNGALRSCSILAGDVEYTCGRAAELESMARGLKNLAGRIRNRGDHSAGEAVNAYAERKAAEARRAWAQARKTRRLWRDE